MEKKEEISTNEYLRGIVLNLPESPGIYQYLNAEGTIIYVGKAKNLKRRVSSYFNREHPNGKTRVLVSKIADIRYIVVKTEEDALLLENNLIKKYRPRYNVMLKDDKTYPSICVSNEYFPRIFKTRKIIRNGSGYYGPYSHVPSMYAVLDLIKKLYPIRTCKLNLTQMDENSAYINYLHITNGCINQAFTFEYKKRLNETKEELLQLGIVEMRERYNSTSREIIVPFEVDMEMNNVTFTIPQRGEKKHLLDLSVMNVKQYKVDRLKQADKLNPEQKKVRILKEIQDQLHMEKMPAHIECFDNSNIQGSNAVAACVVFKMGKPSKQDYRKFNIKTVEGPDDYASMKEVVRRRYTRLIEEGSPLPDLIITDGGKGQMEVVREVIEDELHLRIPIAGLAKDRRHRTSELLYGFPPLTIGIKQSTPLFHLLENIQDEVHRFAITFHRDKRSKSQVASALDSIPGIGEKRKAALLKTFKSVARIKKATLEEIAAVVGEAAAKNIKESLTE